MNEPDSSSAVTALTHELKRRGGRNLIDREFAGLVPGEAARDDSADHAAHLDAHGIRHESRPIPFEALPYVITTSAYARMGDRFRRLFEIVERVIDLYLAEPAVRDFFRLAPRHDELIRMGAHYRPRIQYCRYDFTLDAAGGPRIYELNTHSPAAATFVPHFALLLRRSRTLARLREAGLRPVPVTLEEPGAFARAVLTAARRAGALERGDNVAVLNSRHLTMTTELDHIAAQFREQGCTTVRCFVEDLRFDGRSLHHDGVPVHVVYNKYDDSRGPEAFECAFSRTTAEVRAYLDAYRASAVFSVNSLPSMYLPEQKSTLAFLWSPLFREYAGREELELVRELVPRTRLVRHLDAGELAEAAAHRERYVLKRSLDTRGRSLLIGHCTPGDRWRAALAAARAEPPGDDHVLQEFAAPERSVTRDSATVHTSLACFLLTGEPAGLIVRTSAEETTNVGRRGFMQPPLLVEEPPWTRHPTS
ncbi:putative circularly permuted ATP-grasp superfamily protein [Streptosporangium becharense]|uniref:Putative circularly permuted ATP-grasp superfamily protein n=1 Tax=Streptosporangium becharense TaxID=1816182 RepID=A0A7W9IBJ2_9ACTN|nr:hypothetical protein [Streptosporangium becharense]MBB2913587.1 putative circularly permuted ATP-grasp superfamily protein [Streptosporangium becharense]MBB5817668.1 putative circularly permuted ATP-grasp superfamily protein [Streptosporangium becharense]